MIYKFVEFVGEGLLVLKSQEFLAQLFSCARLRKPCACVECGEMQPAGASAYRPQTNRGNRQHRICLKCHARIVRIGRAK